MTDRQAMGVVADALRALARRRPGAKNATTPVRVTVRLSGDLDARTTERVAQRLRAAVRRAPGTLEIDMSGVRHLAPAAAAAFFSAVQAARATGTAVVVRHAPAQARTVMRSAGLGQVLCFEEPVDDRHEGYGHGGARAAGPSGQ